MIRAPLASDNAEIGTLWINSATNDWYALTSTGAAGSNWQSSGTAAGNIIATSLTVNPGNITASTGNLSIAGTSTLTGAVTASSTLHTVGASTLSGGLTVNGATTTISNTGAISVDSSGGAISIGSAANAQPINIGTGAAARNITIGNIIGGTGITLDSDDHLVSLPTPLLLGQFLYVGDYFPAAVKGYSVNSSTGALMPVPGSPYPMAGIVTAITADPSGRFLYATRGNNCYYWSCDILAFRINPIT